MATSRAEIEQLIRAADAAGDADSVRVLFGEMDKLTKAPVAKPVKPDFGGVNFSDPYAYYAPKVQRGLGNTGENLRPIVGAGETALQTGTGLAASAVAGFAGMGQGAKNIFSPGMPAGDRVHQVQQALTYQPRTFEGQVGSQAVSDAFDPKVKSSLFNPLTYPGRIGEGLGDISADAGAPASVSATLRTAPELLVPWAVSRGAEAISAAQAAKPKPVAIPTTQELRTATNAAYKRGEESGAMVKADDYAKAADEVAQNARNEALDPVLHPKSSRIVQVLEERKGKDLSLQEAENLRRIALEAEGDVNQIGHQTGDGRIAGKIVDDLDEKIDALAINSEARALNRRKANSQLLDWMMERAENKAGASYTQAGMEHALRKEFQSLANNKNRIKRFTEDQQAAIRKVARGGNMENFLRGVGKFDPTAGVVPAMATAVTGGGLAAAGFAAKRAATRMTVNNVEKARAALVGRGLPNAAQQAKGPQGIPAEVAQTLIGPKQVRSVATIRTEIDRLVQRAGLQGKTPAAESTRAIYQELARLEAELKLAESRGSARGAPAPPSN